MFVRCCFLFVIFSLGHFVALGTVLGQPSPEVFTKKPPIIELYTVGIGKTVMERFGHGSLCVKVNDRHSGDCFNYGTMDLKEPLKLSWGFVRGKSNFYVSVGSLPNMLAHYKRRDRSIWVQSLAVSYTHLTLPTICSV